MPEKDKLQPRGVLHLEEGRQNFDLQRALPTQATENLVEHFWSVAWDLTGKEPYTSETLPHPSVHLVLEAGRSEIVGVMRGRFTRTLEGKGRVFGMKFLPGAFYAICQRPVVGFTDKRVAAADFFGDRWLPFEREVLSQKDIHTMAPLAEKFLLGLKPAVDDEAKLVRRIAHTILSDPSIMKVESLVPLFSPSKRQLQRLFSVYAGVSPKWVIERYRMHEAVEKLSSPARPDLATLAYSLGYFDQAHFTKAFRRMTGKAPGEYAGQNPKGR